MIYDELFKDVKLPRFVKVRQEIDREALEDVEKEILRELEKPEIVSRIKENASIAVTAGSREVANYALILRTICDFLKSRGAKPFIIPAMGSHGGAIAEHQTSLLAHLGITEESTGVPIKSSMETVYLGDTESGLPVYFDKYAAEADGIIPVGRIKIHTCFHGEIESGVMKMLAVGCGKQKGAATMHAHGFANMATNVPETARVSIEKLPVLFGVGVLENACHQTKQVKAMPAELIESMEHEMLESSRASFPRVPFDKVDVMIVDEMGKNVSGTGMDPNITGRSSPLGTFRPFVDRLAVLDLTEESEGSAYGVGNADVITQRLFSKIIMENTYPNGITNRDGKPMMIPPVMPNDKLAIKYALGTLPGGRNEEPRVVWLHNTLCMEEFYISENLVESIVDKDKVIVEGEPCELEFTSDGGLVRYL